MTRVDSIVSFTALIILPMTGFAQEPPEVKHAKAKRWKAITDCDGAAVVFYEWRKFVKKKIKAPYPQYKPEQIVHLAENVLVGQHDDGGWWKNRDWTRIGAPHKLRKKHSTLDNCATWGQIDYLARVYAQTKLKRYADSAVRGIEYILKQQGQGGGWYATVITFNDDTMSGVLRVFGNIQEDRKLYAFVQEDLLQRVKAAYTKGLACTLKCQLKVNGRLTVWCQQHQPQTLKPLRARTFEPAALVSRESVDVVRFLMSIEKPSQEVITAVQAAIAWFDHVKIEGIRIEKKKAKALKYRHHSTDVDPVEVKDPNAPPIWTRYYDLKTEKPIFCTRQRKIVHNYSEVSRERRTGYEWYGNWPAQLLKDYPKWQKKWAPGRSVLKSKPKPVKRTVATAKPEAPSNIAQERAAKRLLGTARNAERMGQRGLAMTFYKKIVKDYPDTEAAKKAEAKLK